MGETIRSKAVYTGRNYDVGPWVDNHFIRCSRCGFINNTDREIHSNDGSYEGWGTTFTVVTSTSAGSGYGPNSPYQAGMQTTSPDGVIMYGTSNNSTDILTNSYGSFSFYPTRSGLGNLIYLGTVSTGTYAVMMLLYNSNIYAIDNNNQWNEFNGTSFVNIAGDPRIRTFGMETSCPPYCWTLSPTLTPLVPQETMDAVVGAGCSQCGTLLYTR